MKIYRLISTGIIAVTLSMICVFSSFAAPTVIVDDSYVWTKTESEWKCVNKDGEPVIGWAVYDDDTYFLDKHGIMKTGWIKDAGSWFYLDETTGILATDQWVDNYYVDSDGKMTKIY